MPERKELLMARGAEKGRYWLKFLGTGDDAKRYSVYVSRV